MLWSAPTPVPKLVSNFGRVSQDIHMDLFPDRCFASDRTERGKWNRPVRGGHPFEIIQSLS